MFEKMRKNQIYRLDSLGARYRQLRDRALVGLDDANLAQRRLGLGAEQSILVYEEIAGKTNEQTQVCGEAIHELSIARANPLIFRGSLKRAEAFAEQCEQTLADMDGAKEAAQRLFQDRHGAET